MRDRLRFRLNCILTSIGVLLGEVSTASASQVDHISIKAIAVNQDTGLNHKHLFPFVIPAGYVMTGLHGVVSTSSQANRLSETFFSLNISNSNKCPSVGEDLKDYNAVFSEYPEFGLANIIVKQVGTRTRSEKIDYKYPIGVPLSNRCGFVTLDGSDFAGKPYRMSLDLKMSIKPTQKLVGDLRYGFHDEYILGANNRDNAFDIVHVWKDAKLYGLIGSIAASTMPGSKYTVPGADWAPLHQVLLYRGGCPMFPNQNQDSDAPQLDASMTGRPEVYSISLNGNNNEALFQPVSVAFKPAISLHKGDCVVHAVHSKTKATKNASAFNTETQMFLETVDK